MHPGGCVRIQRSLETCPAHISDDEIRFRYGVRRCRICPASVLNAAVVKFVLDALCYRQRTGLQPGVEHCRNPVDFSSMDDVVPLVA